jgi:predicted adenylyl cyclase CyaB
MVELKVRVDDHEVLRKSLSVLGAKHVGTFRQVDSYFRVPEGRLKLREVKDDDTAELIYYEREDIAGPKSDDAFLLRIQEPEELKRILKKILSPLVVVEKVREIYWYKGTQIHLDTVENLGKFVEFERQTSDDPQSIKQDRQSLHELMEKLEINPNNLESHSYSDLTKT